MRGPHAHMASCDNPHLRAVSATLAQKLRKPSPTSETLQLPGPCGPPVPPKTHAATLSGAQVLHHARGHQPLRAFSTRHSTVATRCTAPAAAAAAPAASLVAEARAASSAATRPPSARASGSANAAVPCEQSRSAGMKCRCNIATQAKLVYSSDRDIHRSVSSKRMCNCCFCCNRMMSRTCMHRPVIAPPSLHTKQVCTPFCQALHSIRASLHAMHFLRLNAGLTT